jgi:hypothetical protein
MPDIPHENVTASRPKGIRGVAFARSGRIRKRARAARSSAPYFAAAFILS